MRYLMIFSSILFLLAFTSCKKKITIKGRVMNPVIGEGIAGAEVKMERFDGYGGVSETFSTISSADGNFVLEKRSKSGWAHLTVEINGDYFETGWTKDNGVSFVRNSEIWPRIGKKRVADYYAIPYGNLKESIKNTSCFDQNDSLVFNRDYKFDKKKESYDHRDQVHIGCFESVDPLYLKYPMGWHYRSGYYVKNNVKTNFSDSIYINNAGFSEWIFEY